jgi:serine protease Do
MMKYRIVIFISLMLIIGGQFFCHADELRDYICIVEARSLTRSITGSGSGFVYVAEDGTNYILTNEHVVSNASSITIVFQKVNANKTAYDNKTYKVSLVTWDPDYDLALLKLEQNIFMQGFTIYTGEMRLEDEVWTAGFPGAGGSIPMWQHRYGRVSNTFALINTGSNKLLPFLAHTAPTNPGSSGGPLLIHVPTATVTASNASVLTNYCVVGVTCLKGLEGFNFAIPAARLVEFLAATLHPVSLE